MMRRWREAGALALAIGLIGVCGCATTGQGGQSRQAERVEAAQARTKYADPVARASLRESAIEMLESAATSPDPQLRANALEGLGLAPTRLEPLLAAGLTDVNPGVRSVAAVMAGRSGATGLAAKLKPLLDDPSAHVRASAILGLRKMGADVDPTPLAALLLSSESTRVRAQAAFVLGEMGDASGLRLLRAAARSPMPRAGPSEVRLLQLQIAEAMVKLGDEAQVKAIRAALYPSRPEELEAMALAVQILGEIRDQASVDQLIYLSAFRNEAKQPYPAEVRLAVAEALAKLGRPEGVFIAREYATSEIPAVRAQAAHVYGHAGGVEHLGALVRLLDDAEGIVRVSAAAATLRVLERVDAMASAR